MSESDHLQEMVSKRLSRRTLLKSTVAAAAAVGLAACGGDEEAPVQGTPGARLTPTPAAAVIRVGRDPIASSAIIVVLDTLRADHVGCYGNDWIKTPSMDALARESIVFTHAFPESLPTIPMRRALHTGMRVWPFRPPRAKVGRDAVWAGWEPIPDDQTTVAEILGEPAFLGHRTGFVTDTYSQFEPSMNFHRGFHQFRWVRGQEFDRYRPSVDVGGPEVDAVFKPDLTGSGAVLRRFNIAQYLGNQAGRSREEDYQAPRVFREAMNWLEENQRADRFFLLVDVFDPHEPWDPPQEYVDLYDPGYEGAEIISPIYGPSDYLSEAELKHMRALYAGEVTLVDKWLGLFLERARELGMLDNTLLIVTSDHGHQLGEHGLTGKMSQGLWYELVDVPLFIRRPDGMGADTRMEAFAQHHDIMPTVLNALGVAPEVPLPGIDLLDLAAGRIPPRDHVSCGLNEYSWCRDQRYVYITRNDASDRQLFDMTADPLQEHDLADKESGAVEEMHDKLVADAGGSPTR